MTLIQAVEEFIRRNEAVEADRRQARKRPLVGWDPKLRKAARDAAYRDLQSFLVSHVEAEKLRSKAVADGLTAIHEVRVLMRRVIDMDDPGEWLGRQVVLDGLLEHLGIFLRKLA